MIRSRPAARCSTGRQPAGYCGTPLPKKLGIPAAGKALFLGAPADFARLIGPLPPDLMLVERSAGELDYAHVFVTREADLARELECLRPQLRRSGMLWVSWPKRSSRVRTDLTEEVVRRVALESGLVDVRVCAIDATWSALKLIFRLQGR